MQKFREKAFVYIFVFLFALTPIFAFAQSEGLSDQEKLEREEALREELEKVLEDIEEQKAVLQEQQNKSASIESDIAVLDAKIKEAQLKLHANELRIQALSGKIAEKNSTIDELERKMASEKESLAELIRSMRQMSDYSMVEALLGSDSLAVFFAKRDAISSMKSRLLADLDVIQENRTKLAAERESLQEIKVREENLNYAIASEKEKIETNQDQKQVLLAASEAKEQTYEEIVAQREAEAAAIRSALFSLRDSANITFGQALDYARIAEKGTGVRPAFLLAIITQESNLGKNVGRCNIPGQTPNRMWKDIMKPSRDRAPYLAVVNELGLSPTSKPLSCPIGNGWGGAMGPAQFIPSTWAMYKYRVANVTGNSPANPWNPVDAFAASSLFLSDLGAGAQTHSAEWEAAARYYAGGGWQTRGRHYANSVLSIADRIQAKINTLEAL